VRYVKSGILGAFVVLAALLLAFGPRGGPDPQQVQGKTIVTYWEKWTGLEGSQMQQIVDDFNNSVGRDKGIFVQYLSVSSVNQKTLVATAAGAPPDIAGVWDGQIPQFAALDALEPLDEMARRFGITEDYYKSVYWNGCRYEGRLSGLISTPWCVALHYNKEIVAQRRDELKLAGLDPDAPPATLEDLDTWAGVLDSLQRDSAGNVLRIDRAGYLPLEPGWFMTYTCYWFGADFYDPATRRFTLTDPRVIAAYEWIRKYSVKLGGPESMTQFRNPQLGVDSLANPFLIGRVASVQQGPWMANYIENNNPSMNRWKLTPELEVARKDGKLTRQQRRDHTQWGAAPFPVPAGAKDKDGRPLKNVTYAGFDVFVIPRGAKHKAEAFEFIAYVNRPEVMGKLCKLHCKNSPLSYKGNEAARAAFIADHPNPYIEVFEELASSPNAKGVPPIPIWAEVGAEMDFAAQKVYRLTQEPAGALREAQLRLQAKLDQYWQRQAVRKDSADRP
jgi:multiple sugar transport system substrate-binding protein